MHIDLACGGPAELAGDVCVVGAGAAGITVARRLLAGGKSVVILESGGLDYEPAIVSLNDGDSIGEDYYELEHARLRMFGGTTAIWGGRCSALSPIDFERRDWVPGSGWPLSAADLEPYYREARTIFGLSPHQPELSALRQRIAALPAFDPDELATPLWSFDNQFDRFSFNRCQMWSGTHDAQWPPMRQ
jgi:choline dehydrogenase-like flavoprotein